MCDTKDGGPAFPVRVGERQVGQHETEFDYLPGMSLRDWFAGQAMAGMSANEYWNATPIGPLAVLAYNTADAMLAAREATHAAR